MAALGIAQGASISLGLTLFVLRTRTAGAAAELSGMAQTVGYLVAALGPVTVGAPARRHRQLEHVADRAAGGLRGHAGGRLGGGGAGLAGTADRPAGA